MQAGILETANGNTSISKIDLHRNVILWYNFRDECVYTYGRKILLEKGNKRVLEKTLERWKFSYMHDYSSLSRKRALRFLQKFLWILNVRHTASLSSCELMWKKTISYKEKIMILDSHFEKYGRKIFKKKWQCPPVLSISSCRHISRHAVFQLNWSNEKTCWL